MGMTIAEKIIAAAAGVDSVKPGDIYTVQLDHLMSNDGTTHLTVDMYNNKLKNPHIADTKKLVFIVDHNVPSDSPKTAASQKKMRDFARENNIDFWEGKGVCHQIMIENYVRPGQLIFGADSHTCSYGALGAFGTGVGCTDFLYGMVTGQDLSVQRCFPGSGTGSEKVRTNLKKVLDKRCKRVYTITVKTKQDFLFSPPVHAWFGQYEPILHGIRMSAGCFLHSFLF